MITQLIYKSKQRKETQGGGRGEKNLFQLICSSLYIAEPQQGSQKNPER